MKYAPGRKTDVAGSEWTCKMVEHGLVRPSFVPPRPIRQLWDLTRYRTEVIRERAREAQRLEKLLEDNGMQLSAAASDLLGKSARAMLEAMIAGERGPEVLAEFAMAGMRGKRQTLAQALTGQFTDHQAFLARTMLDRIDAVTATEARLSEKVTRQLAPFRRQIEVLSTMSTGPREPGHRGGLSNAPPVDHGRLVQRPGGIRCLFAIVRFLLTVCSSRPFRPRSGGVREAFDVRYAA